MAQKRTVGVRIELADHNDLLKGKSGNDPTVMSFVQLVFRALGLSFPKAKHTSKPHPDRNALEIIWPSSTVSPLFAKTFKEKFSSLTPQAIALADESILSMALYIYPEERLKIEGHKAPEVVLRPPPALSAHATTSHTFPSSVVPSQQPLIVPNTLGPPSTSPPLPSAVPSSSGSTPAPHSRLPEPHKPPPPIPSSSSYGSLPARPPPSRMSLSKAPASFFLSEDHHLSEVRELKKRLATAEAQVMEHERMQDEQNSREAKLSSILTSFQDKLFESRVRERAVLRKLLEINGVMEGGQTIDDASAMEELNYLEQHLVDLRSKLEYEADARRKAERHLRDEQNRYAKVIKDIEKECREPFVVPALLDTFLDLSRMTDRILM